MLKALVMAMRSKDPRTQVGAVIVSEDNREISSGYNGSPKGFSDDDMPWLSSREEADPLKTKYPFVVHAERNAILNFRGLNREFEGARLYTTHFPCNECAKEIATVGIREVLYMHDYDYPLIEATHMIFNNADVNVRKMNPMVLSFKEI